VPEQPTNRRGAVLPFPAPTDGIDELDGDEFKATNILAGASNIEPTNRDIGTALLPRGFSIGDATGELPRLPESGIREAKSNVLVDERSLAGGNDMLSAARQLPLPAPPAAMAKNIAQVPRPTPKMLPVNTAVHQQLIGGRYRIEKRIGQGGMGKVYKVSHEHLSRTFALKIISDTVSETREARELFEREARFASAMQHPNITAVVDYGEDAAVGVFMVMELVEGEALHKILFREKQLSLRYACDIVIQLADALHYIHQQGVVHCDIKTENILVHAVEEPGKRRRVVAKLLDFGLARPLAPDKRISGLSGTPHYVAPERIRGQPATPASDVYSLGVLLYELLTGRVPWDGETQKILAGHLEQTPLAPSSLIQGGLDEALENLVLRALAKDPTQRHRDMAAFIYELRTVMNMMGFGRRKGGVTRRVVIERETNRRDELARMAFDACRLPIALVSADGRIASANPAFSKFVMGIVQDIENMPISSTPLSTAWATVETDIARTLAGQTVRRVLEIEVVGGELRRLLLWLDVADSAHVVLGVQPLDM
jgi:eukaryotic-like serine/threonine-protein kinase